ncbi:MAG: queuosine precursor transporter, partial [Candidatus Saccharimonadales bacterium]|nr:queuosine precursor transporter [Candidatus Saccharimonadales bacterium]
MKNKTPVLDTKLSLLLGLFSALLVAVNFLGIKVIPLFGVSTSVGIFLVPLTFLITDIVAEVYGKQVSRKFVLSGMISLVVVLIATAVFIQLPPHERFETNDQYRTIFGASLRIIFASLTAFGLSQFHDIWAFEFWKQKTQGRFLWLRNNLSTMVSQAIDTLVFMFLAFYGISPKFDAWFILQLAWPYYL